MRALGIHEGDEVIVPTFTFAATANAPIFCGARPVFADIDEETLCISPKSIMEKVTDKTKAIIPVHLAGQPCDMGWILKIAMEHKLHVVEDCAHSLGAEYQSIPTGGLSDISCFSFYATKPMTTGGEGGMLATNNEYLAKQARLMRSHCMTRDAFERNKLGDWRYDVVDLGYNYRMSEPQAALGISQLSRIDRMTKRRARVAKYYNKRLGEIRGIITPKLAKGATSSYHLYIIRVVEKEFGMSRDELFKRLAEKNIECSVHYTPIHLLAYYKKMYGTNRGDCPVAEKIYNQVLSLPIYSRMLPSQMEYVVKGIEELAK
jgi:dTDP-4-amino-4,6-dideoxygalactose transaminase